MNLGKEARYFIEIATTKDIEIMLDEDISSEDYERLGFILYSLGLEDLQQNFFRRNALKFQGVIDWEAEIQKSDVEKYISWLQEFLSHIENSTEHEKVRQLFDLEG